MSDTTFNELYDILRGCTRLDLREISRAVHVDPNRLNDNSPADMANSLVEQVKSQGLLSELETVLRQRMPKRFSQTNKGLDEQDRPSDKRTLTPQEKSTLVTKLLDCQVIREHNSRQRVTCQLFSQEVCETIQDADDQIYVTNLIDKCLNYLWGLECLIEVVRLREQDESKIAALDTLVESINPKRIRIPQLRILKNLFKEVQCPIEDIALYYGKVYPEGPDKGWLPSEKQSVSEKRVFILDCLAAAAPMKNGSLPIIAFITSIITHLDKKRLQAQPLELDHPVESVQDKLRTWIQMIPKDQYLEDATTSAPVISQSPRYILIKFIENSDERSFFVQAWLLDTDYHVIPPPLEMNDDKPIEKKDIPDKINELLKKSYRRTGHKDKSQLLIELYLPLSLLFGDVDHWLAQVDTKRPIKIGLQYQVVVRAYDRIDGEIRAYPAWRDKWDHFINDPKPNKPVESFRIWGPEKCDAYEKMFGGLGPSSVTGLVLTWGLSEGETTNIDIIDAILDSGIPIALWSRQCTHKPEQLKTTFENLLSQRNLVELPQLVLAQRLEAAYMANEQHLGHRLTLLLDDPKRLPPDIPKPSDEQLFFETPN